MSVRTRKILRSIGELLIVVFLAVNFLLILLGEDPGCFR